MASSKRTNNDSFIEMVKCNPVLYDMSLTDYKNIFMKNKIWDEIGEKCNISGDEAKMKWKNLRDTYGKYLKTTKTTTGQSAFKSYSRYSKWQWASSMEFLKDHIGFAPTDTNVAREEESVSDTQNITEPESYNENSTQRSSSVASSERYTSRSGSRKRTSVNEHPVDKVITYLNTKSDKLSSIEHVMLGYAKTIDRFSERRKIITKMKIAQVMMEAELEEEQERSLQRETTLRSYYTTEPNTSQNDRCMSQQSCYSRSEPNTSQNDRCMSQQSCYSRSPQSTNDSELQSALRCIQDNALSPLAPSLTGEGLDYEHEIDYDQQKHSEI
ncbi:uncharacterized protein LOC123668935 isoform X2 [Melitaea cinxia]|uniref:uncharacterized protein LOC123661517 isoform X2 n=1 Tax=Melitaea cinxia TaxID=113334 RepID=UPI001E26F002|nr:uncharacterized protein LOC123661517 isoform X2 [Melitaea cinxia]XP_045453576.1 uncharacterized protein LOC123662825 isoform X2 [Melitaea cinxia]XP_045453647.1 uncharacterized protein LOC123662922 isoform X2 [Melitaea cinxia]XP_045453699.1 uncharacterized protein LOC123662978 isoform X2 [Melitaea cinxia]XP_045456137.1 uncharacterized protein LOC123665957 isoform X2 [Melitaea cinxia]XP_045456779.1 uncharacterized protein LOC123666768 isoform X2 [Melitaea cinxia]XP_045456846.1 uncharacterize